MAVIKCKMCGGILNVKVGVTVSECEFCGTVQTVPLADNEKKIKLFERANKLRIACEFDRAYGVYESIVEEFSEEAEAYWGLLLCKYGIEYVDDPATGKKIPTCHRSSFDSILDDENFDMVMENTDSVAMQVYRREVKQLEEIRKGIIEVSAKEAPYDIFICYKETDENGERTIDSAIAQDIYMELKERGYRIFFSRITLEEKLGQEYEPYIFSALNSAKVMLAFGTKYEYYNAVWVKNEWSRYLKLISSGQKKTLIPCYKDIDAYDMPREFAKLQAQDMGKVGANQDLLRGIEKILGGRESERKEVVSQTEPLMQRMFGFLLEEDWRRADEYCERILDMQPENALAYVGKLMVDLGVTQRELLGECDCPFDNNNNYRYAITNADDNLKNELTGYIQEINYRNEQMQNEKIYQNGMELLKVALTKMEFQKAGDIFRSISDYKDAESLAETCDETYQNRITEAEELLEKYVDLKQKLNDSTLPAYRQVRDRIKNSEIWTILMDNKEYWPRLTSEFDFLDKMCKQEEIIKKLPINVQMRWKVESNQTIYLGIYGKNPIEWKVLKRDGDKVLLLSKFVYRDSTYNAYDTKKKSWEDSNTRKWLNEIFYSYLSEYEREIVLQTKVDYQERKGLRMQENEIKFCNDKIFLLSNEEVIKYLPTELVRVGIGYHNQEKTDWFLRGCGKKGKERYIVDAMGWISSEVYPSSGIRPAMWIDISHYK